MTRARVPGEAKAIAALVAGWAIELALFERWEVFHAACERIDATYGDIGRRFFQSVWYGASWSLGRTLFAATFLVPLFVLARFVARACVREGFGDPLARGRRWLASHRKLVVALCALPGIEWVALRRPIVGILPEPYLVTLGLGGVAMATLAWFGVKGLFAPLGDATPEAVDVRDDEITFAAVAVTRETKAAVAAMAALGVAAAAAVIVAPVDMLWEGDVAIGIGAYAAVASVMALAFRRASRVAVGIDGVRVYGTSRARFFAYRDLDGARLEGPTIDLLRKGKVVLALQAHSADSVRREAILARIEANVARARDPRVAGAHRFVESKPKDDVVRVAMGGGDYRGASITREQLWALVEGPTTEANVRTAAAEALAATIDAPERARLRVAAERCAEPRARVVLTDLASREDDAGARGAARRDTIAAR